MLNVKSPRIQPGPNLSNRRRYSKTYEKQLLRLAGAGPTGLRGFTLTDTHIKYVFVDVSSLRRFAPPPPTRRRSLFCYTHILTLFRMSVA